MTHVVCDEIGYCENAKGWGLSFKNGIDPQVLINAIKEIDAVELSNSPGAAVS